MTMQVRVWINHETDDVSYKIKIFMNILTRWKRRLIGKDKKFYHDSHFELIKQNNF